MAIEVVLPLLGLEQGTGRVLAWRKSEGDPVEKGEILAEVEVDKAVHELQSPAPGILRRILVSQDVEVETLSVLAVITAPGEELADNYVPTPARERSAERPVQRSAEFSGTTGRTERGAEPGTEREPHRLPGRVAVMPLARRLALEYGIDLEQISGTGPGGIITKEDVVRAAEQRKRG